MRFFLFLLYFFLFFWRLSLRSLFIRFQLSFRFVCETPRGATPSLSCPLLGALRGQKVSKSTFNLFISKEIEWVSPNESGNGQKRDREAGRHSAREGEVWGIGEGSRVARWANELPYLGKRWRQTNEYGKLQIQQVRQKERERVRRGE